jgi:hypothetical protein
MTEFTATHVAPEGGLRAWAAPDPTQQPVTTVQSRVEMQVLELRGDWAHIECSNGWSAWVDARKLVTKHTAPVGPLPGPTGPPSVTGPPPTARPAAAATTSAKTGFAEFLARPVMKIGDRSLIVQELIPAGGIILGALLSWLRFKGVSSSNSFDVSLMVLLDYKTKSRALRLGWLLLATAVAAVAPIEKRFHQIALGVAAGASVLYIIQLQRLVGTAGGGVSLTDVLGFGTIITLAASGAGLYWSTRKT